MDQGLGTTEGTLIPGGSGDTVVRRQSTASEEDCELIYNVDVGGLAVDEMIGSDVPGEVQRGSLGWQSCCASRDCTCG